MQLLDDLNAQLWCHAAQHDRIIADRRRGGQRDEQRDQRRSIVARRRRRRANKMIEEANHHVDDVCSFAIRSQMRAVLPPR